MELTLHRFPAAVGMTPLDFLPFLQPEEESKAAKPYHRWESSQFRRTIQKWQCLSLYYIYQLDFGFERRHRAKQLAVLIEKKRVLSEAFR